MTASWWELEQRVELIENILADAHSTTWRTSTMIGRKFCLDEIDYFNTSDDKVDAIKTIVTKYWTRIFWQIRSNYIFRPFLFLPFLFAPVRFFVRFFEIVFSVRLSSFECFRCQWTSIYFFLWWIHFFPLLWNFTIVYFMRSFCISYVFVFYRYFYRVYYKELRRAVCRRVFFISWTWLRVRKTIIFLWVETYRDYPGIPGV